jgi:hypothetical protein
VWDKHEGFKTSSLCPGYSAEFFDAHHNAVVRGKPRLTVTVSLSPVCAHSVVSKIGGSYATTPRLAGRRAGRNWYQRNYPYAWNGARVAYDVGKYTRWASDEVERLSAERRFQTVIVQAEKSLCYICAFVDVLLVRVVIPF